ncbi:MAG: bifunctional 4-hydroxy-2-oxoglutarate aldolase/2-dehydro-3-deoxy-phosphogluconate aldolase, partial [Pseudomonadota bacterium]
MSPAADPQARIAEICAAAPVVPVLTVERPEQAGPLARALVEGGLTALEVTLRTSAALEAIAEMRRAAPEAHVGVGTLRTAADVAASVEAGAVFGVSPGATPALLDAAEAAGLAMLPGAATASEAMALAERGYRTMKFFPASAAGGRPLLKSLAAPLPDLAFCPTGGIDAAGAADWLALPNVVCVGGGWIAPKGD